MHLQQKALGRALAEAQAKKQRANVLCAWQAWAARESDLHQRLVRGLAFRACKIAIKVSCPAFQLTIPKSSKAVCIQHASHVILLPWLETWSQKKAASGSALFLI